MTTTTIVDQTRIASILTRITLEAQKHDAITTLGHKTEKDAQQAAKRWLTAATRHDIILAIEELQTVKGKLYPKTPPYARIDDTLHQTRITQAELAIWLQECLRTTFASGNRYQPLPTHDEAWTVYSRIHTETAGKRFAAESLKYRIPQVKITDKELIDAAQQGFYPDMPRSLHRRLFQLLPSGERARIRQLPETEAISETRKWYESHEQ